MEFIIEEGKCLNKETSTLILPALSIGNVGQLAVDLLVSSTRAERIGYLDDPYILPCVGNDAYGPTPCGELALPLEAYDSRNNGVALVQQRSPVVKVVGFLSFPFFLIIIYVNLDVGLDVVLVSVRMCLFG